MIFPQIAISGVTFGGLSMTKPPPHFRDTNHALSYGVAIHGREDIIESLRIERTRMLAEDQKELEEIQEDGDVDDHIDKLVAKAFQAQLYREAIEVAEMDVIPEDILRKHQKVGAGVYCGSEPVLKKEAYIK